MRQVAFYLLKQINGENFVLFLASPIILRTFFFKYLFQCRSCHNFSPERLVMKGL